MPRRSPWSSTRPAARCSNPPPPPPDAAQPPPTATPLELLFDLCFVVAVAQAAGAPAPRPRRGAIAHGLIAYLIVFFAIWWPWMNFTWFASAYDTDDVPYRLLTFVQIAGVLVVAAGVPRAFEDLDFRIMVVGYVIMRMALVAQWLRGARGPTPAGRSRCASRSASPLVQVGWVCAWCSVGPGAPRVPGARALRARWSRCGPSGRRTHAVAPHHIAERYGLFTIIVLGECVLRPHRGPARDGGRRPVGVMLSVALGGLLLVFAAVVVVLQGAGDDRPQRGPPPRIAVGLRPLLRVRPAIAALGAGLQVAIDATHEPVALSPTEVALAVAIPVAIYTVAMGLLASPCTAVAVLDAVHGGGGDPAGDRRGCDLVGGAGGDPVDGAGPGRSSSRTWSSPWARPAVAGGTPGA